MINLLTLGSHIPTKHILKREKMMKSMKNHGFTVMDAIGMSSNSLCPFFYPLLLSSNKYGRVYFIKMGASNLRSFQQSEERIRRYSVPLSSLCRKSYESKTGPRNRELCVSKKYEQARNDDS